MQEVWITGLGIVSPLGIGRDAVWASLKAGRSGVRAIPHYAQAGWLAPYGGTVQDFDPKEYVQPRKSLKVMAREIQFAFAAAELARQDAGLAEVATDPERSGVVVGSGLLYCDVEELVSAFQACVDEQGFDFNRWGEQAFRELFPLWMLKYLPNMSACHIGIRQDARGPCNTIAHGEVSSLLALDEATQVIRRGHADVMVAGGASSRLTISDLLWHHGARLAQSEGPCESLCRPFDHDRCGMVMGEGAAMFLLENAKTAQARGARPIARILTTQSRCEPTIADRQPPAKAIAEAFAAALESAGVSPSDLSHINAHGLGTIEDDPAEAQAIAQVLAGADVPVTALKSLVGNLGPGGGAVELAIDLIAAEHGVVPPTLNHSQTADDCPVRVVTEPLDERLPTFATLNHTATGQGVATLLRLA